MNNTNETNEPEERSAAVMCADLLDRVRAFQCECLVKNNFDPQTDLIALTREEFGDEIANAEDISHKQFFAEEILSRWI